MPRSAWIAGWPYSSRAFPGQSGQRQFFARSAAQMTPDYSLSHIDDPADPRIAGYRDIRERDLVGRQGLFVAEGEVVLRMLATSTQCEPVSVLIAEKRIEALDPILRTLPPGVPVYAAGQGVMDAIVGFPIHRGILALGRRRSVLDAHALLDGLGEQALVLVLSGIANHDNMGGLFRNAAAFGVDAVILDETCCDPLYRKAIRVSVGASLILPYATLAGDLVAGLEQAGLEALALSPQAPTELSGLVAPARAAVILGAEGPGLSAEILQRARGIRVPMATGFDSLNVATTSGIVLHHLVSNRP